MEPLEDRIAAEKEKQRKFSRESKARAYAADPEKQRERSRRYRSENLEACRERDRKRRTKDAEKRRAGIRKRVYGITQEQWDALFTSQGSACAICKVSDPGTKRHWHTDHDHAANKVRGILCHYCNTGLGAFRDSLEHMRAGVVYLEAAQSNLEG